MKNGEKFWCIQPSTEAESYGETAEVEPWQGIYEDGVLYRFNPETDEIDYDTNASAHVAKVNLYKTKEAAQRHYVNVWWENLRKQAQKHEEEKARFFEYVNALSPDEYRAFQIYSLSVLAKGLKYANSRRTP